VLLPTPSEISTYRQPVDEALLVFQVQFVSEETIGELRAKSELKQFLVVQAAEDDHLTYPQPNKVHSVLLSRFLDRKRVPNGHERCSCFFVLLWGSCCYQIFISLRLCRFSTDRNEAFHTY